MSTVTTVPGVYIEEDASPTISVSQGATAVPLFIARFEPLEEKYRNRIIRINSWLDFSQKFSTKCKLTATVTITSEKGEKAEDEYKYEIKNPIVNENSASLALQLYFQNGGNTCYVIAIADIEDSTFTMLPSMIEEVQDITLILSPDSNITYRALAYLEVAPCLEQNKGYFLLADSNDGKIVDEIASSAHVAAYYPMLSYNAVSIELNNDDVIISGYADVDNPEGTEISTLSELIPVNPEVATKVTDELAKNTPSHFSIPPSALVAGVYCKSDRTQGVWKAPANVVLNGISGVTVRVTDTQQSAMNEAGINAIRHFNDRGYVVWGARTLQDDDNWRYISVRRLFDAAERDIKKAMRAMVFEPNNQLTWKRVKIAIENYLHSVWQQGGLSGNKAEEAYYVRIGKDITMTTDDINQGKMIVQVGMAAVRPAEFIILQFTQDMTS